MASTGFGPLVEPGWPDLTKGAPDTEAAFMKGIAGAATLAEIGAKRQRLENALAMYALKANQLEFNQQMQQDKFDLAWKTQQMNNDLKQGRLELDTKRADNSAQHWYNMHQEGLAREQRLSDIANDKIKKAAETQEASDAMERIEYQVRAENPNLEPGSDALLAKLREAAAPYISKLPTSSRNSWDKRFTDQHNVDRNWQAKNLETDRKIFNANVARELQAGDTLNIDYDKFLHPETLPAWTTSTGWGPWKETTTTPDKQIMVKDPSGQLVPRRVTMDTLNRFKTQLNELNNRQKNIGTLLNRPDIGVSGAEPWPSNGRAGLRPGHTYLKPDGSGDSALWTGTDFVTP